MNELREKVKVKVTVEFENGSKMILEDYYLQECQETRGVKNIFSTKEQKYIELIPNGHYKFCIKGFKGCDSYESFIAEEEVLSK